jgi:tripartite-type tricarboxylate transporter receptor subunit TctC
MLKSSAGIDMTHVPYKGFGNAVVDAAGCNVDLLFGAISSGIPHIRSGKLKAIAVTQPARHPGLPDTPTFAEAGHPSVAMDAYFGMVAPAGTPRAVIEKLNREIVAILKEKETLDRFQGAGLDVVGSTPGEFSARIKADLDKFAKVAKLLGAKAE